MCLSLVVLMEIAVYESLLSNVVLCNHSAAMQCTVHNAGLSLCVPCYCSLQHYTDVSFVANFEPPARST